MLEQVKRYLRIDGSEQDILLTSLVTAAKQYMANAGIPDTCEQQDLYILAVSLYVGLMYDGVENKALDKAMTAIILQLKNGGAS